MDSHIGQQDAEETLSEIHERERTAFQTNIEHQQAICTNILADAYKDSAKAELYKSAALAILVSIPIAGVAAIRGVIRRW